MTAPDRIATPIKMTPVATASPVFGRNVLRPPFEVVVPESSGLPGLVVFVVGPSGVVVVVVVGVGTGFSDVVVVIVVVVVVVGVGFGPSVVVVVVVGS